LHGELGLGPQGLVRMLDQDARLVVVADGEDLRRVVLAHRIAFAQVLIHDHSHRVVADVAGRLAWCKIARGRYRPIESSGMVIGCGKRIDPSGVSRIGTTRSRTSTGLLPSPASAWSSFRSTGTWCLSTRSRSTCTWPGPWALQAPRLPYPLSPRPPTRSPP